MFLALDMGYLIFVDSTVESSIAFKEMMHVYKLELSGLSEVGLDSVQYSIPQIRSARHILARYSFRRFYDFWYSTK
jgi:hypothetical protein